MRRFLLISIAPLLTFAQTAPTIAGVRNGASFTYDLCPGALASLFGSDLASGTAIAENLPLPKKLGETEVFVHDPTLPSPIPAPLYFVSAGQINFQIPFEATGKNVTVSVSTSRGSSKEYPFTLNAMAPGIFSSTSNGLGTALAFDTGFHSLTATPPAGSTIVVYATGLGATNPPATSGTGGNGSLPFNEVAGDFEVYVGGRKATVAWAGLAPGLAGVYQLNITPAGEEMGDILIACRACNSSNNLQMPRAAFGAGSNTANVTGSLSILYPTGYSKLSYTPAFLAATFSTQFDILPNAGKFTLSTEASIGSIPVDGATIQFDPAAGSYLANVPSPTAPVRFGDFSQTGVQVFDFLMDCSGSPCPMPGNIVPLNRQDPALVSALRAVPLPNMLPNGLHSFYDTVGEAHAGASFVADGNTHSDVVTFASAAAVPRSTAYVPVTVKLLVDGRVIATATAVVGPLP